MAMALGPAFLEAAKAGEVARLREMLAGGGAAKLLAYRGEGTPDAVSGNTALHWAAARGHAEALRVLLAAGAPLAITNHGGSTALQAAVLNGHVDAARLLRRHGADAHAKDEFGDSALDLAKVRRTALGDAGKSRPYLGDSPLASLTLTQYYVP